MLEIGLSFFRLVGAFSKHGWRKLQLSPRRTKQYLQSRSQRLRKDIATSFKIRSRSPASSKFLMLFQQNIRQFSKVLATWMYSMASNVISKPAKFWLFWLVVKYIEIQTSRVRGKSRLFMKDVTTSLRNHSERNCRLKQGLQISTIC